MVMNEANDEGTRFSALLNPIRDLAASWGIDVARELSDYAESLGFHVDDNLSGPFHTEELEIPVDFAEAALLVQGSTSIYSRKVEHLYSLVYAAVAALNQIQGRSRASGNGTTEPADRDADADALLNIDDVDFLTLDDEVATADPKTITLSDEVLPPLGSLQDATSLRPVPPMLIQAGGSSGVNLGRANYKVLSAHIHPSGALIMEGCPPVDENLEALPQRCQPEDNSFSPSPCGDDRERGWPGFDRDELLEFATPPLQSESADFRGEDVVVAVAGSARKNRGPHTVQVDVTKRPKPMCVPLWMLDPHERIPSLDRPLRVGKTYRRPRGDPPPELSELELPDEDTLPRFTVDVADRMLGPIPRGVSIRNCLFFEGNRRHFREVVKKRGAAKRRQALLDMELFDRAVALQQDDENLEEADANETRSPASSDNREDFGDDESSGFGAIPELPGLNDIDDEGPSRIGDDSLGQRLGGQFTHIANTYAQICYKHLEKTAQLWRQKAGNSELVQRVERWTVRIQPILEDEERRPEFDISVYGRHIIQSFSEKAIRRKSQESKMTALFQASTRYEVCRMFLATLQLANNGTVEIFASGPGNVWDPSVKLLCGPGEVAVTTPVRRPRAKRIRQPGTTPKSARRQPLRARTQP